MFHPCFIRAWLALLLLPIALQAQTDPALSELSASTALGGPAILDIIKNAQTVTAQRIDSHVAETPEQAPEHPKIITLGEVFPVPEPEAFALKKVFCEGSTYLAPSKTCEFRANVRYGFAASDDRKLDLILCFGCGELEVRQADKIVSFGPFDGGYGEILALTQKVFPKDEFLAAFSEKSFKERPARMQVPKP